MQRIDHLPPSEHRSFYNAQHFTLNITRADMIKAGYSPSVRLFEAAACGVPIISDFWEELETIFEIGSEILVANSTEDILNDLQNISEKDRLLMGEKARNQVFSHHTAGHRAAELEQYALTIITN